MKQEIRNELLKIAENYKTGEYYKFEAEITKEWADWMDDFVKEYEEQNDYKYDIYKQDREQEFAEEIVEDNIKSELYQIFYEAHEEECECQDELMEKAEEIREIYEKYSKGKVKEIILSIFVHNGYISIRNDYYKDNVEFCVDTDNEKYDEL